MKKETIVLIIAILLASSLACNAVAKIPEATNLSLSQFKHLGMTMQTTKAYLATEVVVGITHYHPKDRGNIFLVVDYKASGNLESSEKIDSETFYMNYKGAIYSWQSILWDQTLGEISMVYSVPKETDIDSLILVLPNGTEVKMSQIYVD